MNTMEESFSFMLQALKKIMILWKSSQLAEIIIGNLNPFLPTWWSIQRHIDHRLQRRRNNASCSAYYVRMQRNSDQLLSATQVSISKLAFLPKKSIVYAFLNRFCDLSSVVTFIKSWSAIARGLGEAAVLPDFVGSSLLPPKDLPPLPAVSISMGNRITTKLLFDATKIAALKSKASSSVPEILVRKTEQTEQLLLLTGRSGCCSYTQMHNLCSKNIIEILEPETVSAFSIFEFAEKNVNLVVLEDTKCGNGVQDWVSLFPEVMAIFERDEGLLEFASVNPNAIF
ncbi:hypothetical protein FEM48_Zijuj05G0040900 [Ziziphus jujuba var. spinosa]|uniref:Uncharacterized protein n=1 Tax=Ziziphus jujuba var. spinosa TaxID=714518 RepID=A0A978VCQ7_ZIZJJ|nr:hypothetical protein FEM48_Zijuj05G0040900 [Ziziphus jujuba var. spinosa]